ncbi:hypothetical protein HaLaN_13739 [Haematococcus lacustris]|uniref:Uncharacterized protein n=1 Tax=Haematococcus lacustris TaxID=44745 RepID=A0A699ZDX6_HAELA|nr:hypothetical protein HaLaN_13739 [Haematococcus lacustris]
MKGKKRKGADEPKQPKPKKPPKWAEQKMRLHGAQEKVLERYFKKLEEEAAVESQKRWGTRKQLVVFFSNAGIGTRGLPQGGGEAQQRQANRQGARQGGDSG